MLASIRASVVASAQRRALASTRTTVASVARRGFAVKPRQVSTVFARASRPLSTTARRYTTTTAGAESSESQEKARLPDDAPWIDVLESTAQGPWLTSVPRDEVERLQIAHALLMQVVMYLQRGMQMNATESGQVNEDEAVQYLALFQTLPLSNPTAEMARARHAIALIAHSIVLQILSIPPTSALRHDPKDQPIFAKAKDVYDVNDKFKAVFKRDVDGNIEPSTWHLNKPAEDAETTTQPPGEMEGAKEPVEVQGNPPPWSEYWQEMQPRLLALLEQLDKSGYDLSAKEREGAAGAGQ